MLLLLINNGFLYILILCSNISDIYDIVNKYISSAAYKLNIAQTRAQISTISKYSYKHSIFTNAHY